MHTEHGDTLDGRCLRNRGGGDKLVWSFIGELHGRDRKEAIALVKLLEDKGNTLRRPRSGSLGEGLFELRGKQVRIFYVFEGTRKVVLLDGEIKKRNDIPKKTLDRMRRYQKLLRERTKPKKAGKKS